MRQAIHTKITGSTCLLLLLILCMIPALPGRAETFPDKPEKGIFSDIQTHSAGTIWVVEKESDSFDEFPFDLKYKGRIELSDDDQSIISISANGFFEVSKVAFGNNRKLSIRPDENGKLNYEYFVGKTREDYLPEGKKWLAEILPGIVRKTEIGVESRVRRIYNKNGLDGFFKELELLKSSNAGSSQKWSFFSIETISQTGSSGLKNTYFKTLVFDNKLKEKDLTPLLARISEIASNSTKGTLLRHILEHYQLNADQLSQLLRSTSTLEYNTERGSVLRLVNKQFREDFSCRKAYFDIIDEMEINSEKGNVLKDLVMTRKLEDPTWLRLLQSMNEFSSERERGAVLLMLLEYMPKSEEVMRAFRNSLEDLSDSYYVLKGEITDAMLEAALSGKKNKPDKQTLLSYLKTGQSISSNSQRGLILRKANRLFIDDPEVLDLYFYIIQGMDSELETYNVLLDLLHKNKLSDGAMRKVLHSVDDLLPDYQHAAGAVLRQVTRQFPLGSSNMELYFSLVKEMDQNATIEEVLRTVIDQPNLSTEMIVKTIECLEYITVDVERSVILTRLSPHINSSDSTMLYIYKSMANKLESDYEKYRVLQTIE